MLERSNIENGSCEKDYLLAINIFLNVKKPSTLLLSLGLSNLDLLKKILVVIIYILLIKFGIESFQVLVIEIF